MPGIPGSGAVRVRSLRLATLAALLLAGSTSWPLHAQPSQDDSDYVVTNWQTEQGLPENSATAMVQMPDGFLWFGTFNGLVRFDGQAFTVLDTSNTPELPSAGIVNLHLDRSGALWVSTLRGIARKREGNWERFGPDRGWTANFVRHFAESRDGLFVTSFDNRAFRFAGERFEELPGLKGVEPWGTFPWFDSKGRLHALQGPLWQRWNENRWEQVETPVVLRRTPVTVRYGRALDGSLLAWSSDRLWRLRDGRIEQEIHLEISPQDYWSLTEDSQGFVWFASYDSGLYRISKDGGVRHYSPSTGFPSNSVRFVFLDREGNRWVGTSGGGLLRFRTRRFASIGRDQGLPDFPVKSATVLDGSVLIATYGGGVHRFQDGRLTRLSTGLQWVQSILADRAGRVWFGTFGEGLSVLKRAADVPAPETSLGWETIQELFEDSRGRIWVSGERDAAVLKGDRFRTVPVESKDALAYLRCFAEEPQTGKIFAGGDEGLFELTDARFRRVLDASGRLLPPLSAIHSGSRGTLWLGSPTEGLLRWDHRSRQVTSFKDAIALRTVSGILADGEYFWLATNRGVWRVRRGPLEAMAEGRRMDLEWQAFGLGDGLPSLQCADMHQLRDAAGRMYFATLKGLAIIDPRRLALHTDPIPVRFEEIRYVEEDTHQRRLALTGLAAATVPPGSRDIRITYSAIDLAAPEKVLFSYALEQGGRVVLSGQSRERGLDFLRLEPGDYRLKISARNCDGFWNPSASEIQLTVQAFYWQTTAFRWIAFLAGVGALFTAVSLSDRLRLRRTLEKLEREREVAQLKARLALVLENTSDAVLFETPEGDLFYMNRAAKTILGLAADTEPGRIKTREIYSDAAYERMLTEALPAVWNHGSWQGYTTLRHRDGHEVPMWLSLVAHGPDQATVEFVSTIARDMTEIQRGEKALRASEEKFSKAFHASPDAIMICRLSDGSILEVNEGFEKMFGRTRSQVAGHPLPGLQLFPDAETAEKLLENLRACGSVSLGEAPYRGVGGARAIALISGERTEVQGIPCAVLIVRDLTERHRLEEAIRHAQKMESVGRLAGGIAHDFNNLLTVINGYCDLILKQNNTPEGVRGQIAQVRTAGARAADLTQQLLAFSRKQVIEPKLLSLNEVILDAEKMLRVLLGEDVELVVNLDPHAGMVLADASQLHQVLMNLAVNARHAILQAGTIEVETSRLHLEANEAGRGGAASPGPYVRLRFSDTGCGMDEETKQHIFEPYFTTKEGTRGTGLGLSTVDGIVTQSGGWIEVQSEPGRGTTFIIYLPEAAPGIPRSAGAASATAPSAGRGVVLVVEDQDEVRQFAVTVLRLIGYTVLDARDGTEAVTLCRSTRGRIDLLFTDVVMPGMNGRELAEQCRKLRPGIRVLYMSGYPTDLISGRGALEPGVAYLPKPFDPEALAAKVKEVLESTPVS